MSHNNHGSQNGDGSINVGVGDFRGLNLYVGDNDKPTFTPEQIRIRRNSVFSGDSVRIGNLSIFRIVAGIASVMGLYFTLFQAFPRPEYSSWSTLFIFSLAIAVFSFAVAVVLRKRKFEYFLFRKLYLEAGPKGRLYLNSFTATCPWCGAKMNLRNVGPKMGPRDDLFICERNPKQHTIILDPTVLPEVEE